MRITINTYRSNTNYSFLDTITTYCSMAGTKRAAEEAGSTERVSKAAKTSSSPKGKGKKGGAKKGAKAAIPASAFKAKALPLHVNITHTPPSIVTTEDADTVAPEDVGFIGTLTLVPSTFSTGSYGWKGSKRITVELQGSETGEHGKEKVHVMLNINATVMGSKQAEGEAEGAKEPEKDEEETKEGEEDEEKEE